MTDKTDAELAEKSFENLVVSRMCHDFRVFILGFKQSQLSVKPFNR